MSSESGFTLLSPVDLVVPPPSVSDLVLTAPPIPELQASSPDLVGRLMDAMKPRPTENPAERPLQGDTAEERLHAAAKMIGLYASNARYADEKELRAIFASIRSILESAEQEID